MGAERKPPYKNSITHFQSLFLCTTIVSIEETTHLSQKKVKGNSLVVSHSFDRAPMLRMPAGGKGRGGGVRTGTEGLYPNKHGHPRSAIKTSLDWWGLLKILQWVYGSYSNYPMYTMFFFLTFFYLKL